ncbi:hypothetical protein A2V49_03785 [candidate division WWE3 bacterium RBG_19FT_COMBO_34_6]|uniref:Uncharacterized protein n=1 Tax=candidate division WWE3 bacterium RBG_19FT_COMBO_34_6 TaxID=1802612 RepID=A0A1F4UL11_UNCKA|nr:MAG: hypothetical protein A2V49_03785 [candidate division WWE3 bacterium RBG_19FT_COMBO_34_6]
MAYAHELEEVWIKKGRITGLPLTFKVSTGDTVRLLSWFTHFLNAYRDSWRRWYEKTGELCLIVIDNFSALRLSGDDPLLGDLPEATGRNLGLLAAWGVSNGRNNGLIFWLLTHSVEDFDYISTGIYPQLGLVVSLNHDDHKYAQIIQPKEHEVMASNVSILLPEPIASVVGRQELKGKSGVWMQKPSSEAS